MHAGGTLAARPRLRSAVVLVYGSGARACVRSMHALVGRLVGAGGESCLCAGWGTGGSICGGAGSFAF